MKPILPLALAAACAAPLLAQAQNCTSPNADSDYIVGTFHGVPSAMHWPTGLVWQRCAAGRTLDDDGQCAGSSVWYSYSALAVNGWEPQPGGVLNPGWRLPYVTELVSGTTNDGAASTGITANCGDGPKINRTVFPDTPQAVFWTGSPANADDQFLVHFSDGVTSFADRSTMGARTRLVRGGYGVQTLPSLTGGIAVPGVQVTFTTDPITGGVRIEGEGGPEFQVEGSGPWLQEALVTDQSLTVRMTAPATAGNSHTATLRLRGRTITPNGSAGDAPSALAESTTLYTVDASTPGVCGSARGVPTRTAPTAGLCSVGTPTGVNSGAASFIWSCGDADGGIGALCIAPRRYRVTPVLTSGPGMVDPSEQDVAYGGTAQFLFAPATSHRLGTVSGCNGTLAGSTYTTGSITADCTVSASFDPIPVPAAPQITSASASVVTGTAEPGAVVEVFEGSTSLGTTTADASTGRFQFTSPPLSTGPHHLTARARNGGGTSPASPAVAVDVPLWNAPVGGRQVRITSSINGCTVQGAGQPAWVAAPTPLPAVAHTAVTAPLDALAFTATQCAGSTLTVQVDYPAGSLAGLAAYKHGPGGWFANGSVQGDSVTYTVADDGPGDSDTATPGAIRDPHAMLQLTAAPAAIPTLGEWGMALLGALLGLFGLRRRASDV